MSCYVCVCGVITQLPCKKVKSEGGCEGVFLDAERVQQTLEYKSVNTSENRQRERVRGRGEEMHKKAAKSKETADGTKEEI